jgi:membrane protease YdiL (CAAX protease family)
VTVLSRRGQRGNPKRTDAAKSGDRLGVTVRAVGLAIGVAYVIRLLTMGGYYADLGGVVGADCLAGLTLWRLGRIRSLPRAQLLENIGYLTVFALAIAVTVLARPKWLATAGAWPWYVAGLVVGLCLIWVSGLRPAAIASGELAFLAGSKPVADTIVGSAILLAAGAAEEVMFRGPALARPLPAAIQAALLGAVLFVARHHFPGWASVRRSAARIYAIEIASSLAFVILTIMSGSIYPAVVAHVISNCPAVIILIQRGRMEDSSHGI